MRSSTGDELGRIIEDQIAHSTDAIVICGTVLASPDDVLIGKARNTAESIFELHPVGSGNWVNWMFGRNLSNWDESFTWAKWGNSSRDLIKAYQNEGIMCVMLSQLCIMKTTWSNYYPSSNYPFMYKCRSSHSNIIKLRLADILC